jgi:hypothetical protein
LPKEPARSARERRREVSRLSDDGMYCIDAILENYYLWSYDFRYLREFDCDRLPQSKSRTRTNLWTIYNFENLEKVLTSRLSSQFRMNDMT